LVGVDFARQNLLQSFVEFSAGLELRRTQFASVFSASLRVMLNPGFIFKSEFALLLDHRLDINAFALVCIRQINGGLGWSSHVL
jgi:hypothetical protein